MTNYEKPEVIRIAELSEGVYMASGSVVEGGTQIDEQTPVCRSRYLMGVWHRPNRGFTEQGPALEKYGCEGCSADDGDGCKIAKGKAEDLNGNGDFRPTWERNGHEPGDMVW